MTSKKGSNVFGEIISARQQDTPQPATLPPPVPVKDTTDTATGRKGRVNKRGNPDYTPVTVYLRTERYARAQYEMARQGRKREMSELIDELLDDWIQKQS